MKYNQKEIKKNIGGNNSVLLKNDSDIYQKKASKDFDNQDKIKNFN